MPSFPEPATPASARDRSPRGERGAVLVLVLAFIALLSLIVTAFVTDAARRIRFTAQFHQQDDLRVAAYGAMETALAVLSEFREIDGDLWGPAQGWADPLAVAALPPPEGITLEARIVDESGKFAMSRLDETLLPLLLEELGLEFMQAQELTDALLDWIDADDEMRLNGAERDWYEDLEVPYRPANHAPRSFEELALVKGWSELFFDGGGRPNGLMEQFAGAVSLHHEGRVNLNAASGLVLATLARLDGFDPASVERHRAGDDGEVGTADDRVFRDLRDPTLPINLAGAASPGATAGGAAAQLELRGTTFTVTATASRGEARFQVVAIVRWVGSDGVAAARVEGGNERGETRSASTGTGRSTGLGYPFTILLLRENQTP